MTSASNGRNTQPGSAVVRALAVVAGVGVLLSIAAYALVSWVGGEEPAGGEGPSLPIEMRLGEFRLTSQDNEPITHDVLDDAWTVVDFIFTDCPLYCPGMTAQMRRVQEATQGTGLRLLSISIDGETDTPEVLRAYAEMYQADLDRWVFATGPNEVTWRLAGEDLAFNVGFSETQQVTGADGVARAFIDHPTRLLLVGPDRTVRGMYAYNDNADIDRLIEDAKRVTAP